MKTEIKFINHASVLIRNKKTSLLSDPWYNGFAFNKGWSLLYENSEREIKYLLKQISYIWISHEHPDHFSVEFFNKFTKEIQKRNITVLFQETTDKRVVNYFKSKNINIKELVANKKYNLGNYFFVTCFKFGFYDSILYIECEGEKILNLNDCALKSASEINKIYDVTKDIDVLLTQFSIAAWKGGDNNQNWRVEAGREKISSIAFQIKYFNPKTVIPFASYIYFSNHENFYLNTSINRPSLVYDDLKGVSAKLIFMKPGDVIGGAKEKFSNNEAIKFWEKLIDEKKIGGCAIHFSTVEEKRLIQSFYSMCERIRKKNNIYLMYLIRYSNPFEIFAPLQIEVYDLQTTFRIDILKTSIKPTYNPPALRMHSEALFFLFNNSFGFDTLTVNSCFEEAHKNGFYKAAKVLAIENLNNIGIYFNLKIFLNLNTIYKFIKLLFKVKSHLRT